MSEESSLLGEFRTHKFKETRCVVCYVVAPEVREVVEDGIKRGLGSVAISNFLRERGLWNWSNSPVDNHRSHM